MVIKLIEDTLSRLAYRLMFRLFVSGKPLLSVLYHYFYPKYLVS